MSTRNIADAGSGTRHVFLRYMLLDARIGIYAHEQAAHPIRVNVDLAVDEVGGRTPWRRSVGIANLFGEQALFLLRRATAGRTPHLDIPASRTPSAR